MIRHQNDENHRPSCQSSFLWNDQIPAGIRGGTVKTSTVVPPPACKLHLWEHIKETKADKKLALAELMLVCNDHLKKF